MDHTHDTLHLIVHYDPCTSAVQERWMLEGFDEIWFLIWSGLAFVWNLKDLHDPVQQAVYNFKARIFVIINCSQITFILGSNICKTSVIEYKLQESTLPLVPSKRITSDTSNNFRGKGIFLLEAIVLNSPDISVVRATWKSIVLGLDILTALFNAWSLRILLAMSSREHLRWRKQQ